MIYDPTEEIVAKIMAGVITQPDQIPEAYRQAVDLVMEERIAKFAVAAARMETKQDRKVFLSFVPEVIRAQVNNEARKFYKANKKAA